MDPDVAMEFGSKAKEFVESISEVEEKLAPFLDATSGESFDSMMTKLDPIDRARTYILLSYTINTLFFAYLRTEGATKGHPVRKELMRIKDYMDKAAKVGGKDKPTTRIDQDAAKRFVRHGLNNHEKSKAELEQQAESFLSNLMPTEPKTSEPAAASSQPLKAQSALAKAGKKKRPADTLGKGQEKASKVAKK
ncbi:hypothetical protein BC829DRAFT_379731 [Chytridium lagenaria]|nr:hypothetical protein BC829DRAFT_379731 [Chytridium lagenaria]